MRFESDHKPLTNADVVREYLKEQTSFDLYPEQHVERSIHDQLNEEYNLMYAQDDIKRAYREYRNAFMEDTREDLLCLALYTTFVSPVLESMYATDRQYDIAADSIKQFVQEQGVENLLNQFQYQSAILSDIGDTVEKYYTHIMEGVDCKIKEGLPEDQAYEVEDKTIKSFVTNCKCKCPHDITNTITKRVEDAVNDFIDEKKKSQFKIQQIYQQAKAKVDEYNQANQSFDNMNQTDAPMDGNSMDPEVGIDNNLNAKLDAQQDQDIANLNDPSMQAPPNPTNPGGLTPAQEALAWAKNQEAMILESNYSIFDAMVRVLMEGTYKNDVLKESYMGDNGKTSLGKIINDVKAMYTVLETCNILNLIELNEEYLENMLKEMHDSI